MKMMVAACVLVGVWTTNANAVDLAELAPCKSAALHYCDRNSSWTWDSLVRCGARLASVNWLISRDCRAVLKKYGQL